MAHRGRLAGQSEPGKMNRQEIRAGVIMLVDDNPVHLKQLEEMIRPFGQRVLSFPRGRLALVAAEREPPDLVLLDISMPDLDGYQVCERFKASPRLKEVSIIFLVPSSSPEDRVKAFRSGASEYILTPFESEEVRARVQSQLAFRRTQKAERDTVTQLCRRDLGIDPADVAGFGSKGPFDSRNCARHCTKNTESRCLAV